MLQGESHVSRSQYSVVKSKKKKRLYATCHISLKVRINYNSSHCELGTPVLRQTESYKDSVVPKNIVFSDSNGSVLHQTK